MGITPRTGSTSRIRRLGALATGLALALGTCLTLTVGGAGAASVNTGPDPQPVGTGGPVLVGSTARSDDGSYAVAENVIQPGTIDVDIWSAAFRGPIRTRVILPANWSTAPAGTTWPTLYVYMGGTGSDEPFAGGGWTNDTDITSFMSSRDVLTVIPDDDHAGLFANWVGPSFSRHLTKPQFETFDAYELPQVLTRAYRSSGRNAVLGNSFGGGGAMYMAAVHPGLFRAAAAMSSLLNLQNPASWPLVAGAELRVGENPWGPYGDPLLGAANWAAHNPVRLVTKLRGIPLFVSAGNGTPSALDPGAPVDANVIEGLARLQGNQFVTAATAAGDDITSDFYGNGSHTWPYWNRELAVAWPVLARGLGVAGT